MGELRAIRTPEVIAAEINTIKAQTREVVCRRGRIIFVSGRVNYLSLAQL